MKSFSKRAAVVLAWLVLWIAVGAANADLGVVVFLGGIAGGILCLILRKRKPTRVPGSQARTRMPGNPLKAVAGLFKSTPESTEIVAARAKLAEAEDAYKQKSSAAKAAVKAAETAYNGSKVASFKGNKLTTTMLNGKPVHGARATVDANGSAYANSRLTVTRMVTLGVFSLAAPKRKTVDNRELYLNIITGDGEVKVIKCDPKLESNSARQFAAKVSTLGNQAPDRHAIDVLLNRCLATKKAAAVAVGDTAVRDAAKSELERLLAEQKAAKSMA